MHFVYIFAYTRIPFLDLLGYCKSQVTFSVGNMQVNDRIISIQRLMGKHYGLTIRAPSVRGILNIIWHQQNTFENTTTKNTNLVAKFTNSTRILCGIGIAKLHYAPSHSIRTNVFLILSYEQNRQTHLSVSDQMHFAFNANA